ncbi:hypothetical protein [Anaeromicropila herbilytica]|uniref:Uncharacterized protein n=1 Tax=Anaeromicropila herbilytica TaxID=2785025 RepID=A0A7R7EP05_9FIRM|nr:hypothetical protein [Anaeromicropila herbilytica]BCN32364.1 hypothetical protein bsdtb5_36590 [Anaeromicropila herbilytica]
MVIMHSKAYEEFVLSVNTNGYRQGYDSLLFSKIDSEERDEIEKIVVDIHIKKLKE